MDDQSEFTRPPEVKEKKETVEDVYLRLLGLKEMPERPANLPRELVLPPRVLGHLATSIEDTRTDGLERSQLIFWNKFLHDFQPHQVKIGNEGDTGTWNSIGDRVKTHFLGDKALATYHIHPREHYPGFNFFNCFPSLHDMNMGERFPNEAFIRIVGAADGIVFIFQTKQSLKARIQSNDELIDRMLKTINPEHAKAIGLATEFVYPESQINAQVYDKMLRSEGFGFYMWRPTDIRRGISPRESAQLQRQGVKLKTMIRNDNLGFRSPRSSEPSMPFNRWIEHMKKSESRRR